MQSQSDNTNSNDQVWNVEEIRELLEYVNHLREHNETLQASVIMMQAKLDNEEAKVRGCKNIIKQLTYGAGINFTHPN
jgi:uncharacterized protein YlxW (UPF0749 family)